MSIGSILFGLFGIAIGAVLVIKTDWFVENFGRIEWAETHLGTEGGTRLFYKLIGIGIIILSFMLMTGMVQLILKKIFAPGRL